MAYDNNPNGTRVTWTHPASTIPADKRMRGTIVAPSIVGGGCTNARFCAEYRPAPALPDGHCIRSTWVRWDTKRRPLCYCNATFTLGVITVLDGEE